MPTAQHILDAVYEQFCYESRMELRREDLDAEFRAAMDECPECDEDFGEVAAEMDAYYGEGN